jgi:hypothetical protein
MLSTTRRKAVHGDEMLFADSRSTLDTVFSDASLDEETSTDGGVKATLSAPCIHEPPRSSAKMDDKSWLYLYDKSYYVVQKVRRSPPLPELLGVDRLLQQRS